MKKAGFNRTAVLWLCLTLVLFTGDAAKAQPAGTTNFYAAIKAYHLAPLWRADRLHLLSLKEEEPFPEPYGTLGKKYQRFYIHYTSVIKDPAHPYQYQVKGKTTIGNQVCSFTGTITNTQAGIYKLGSPYAPETYKGYKRGQAVSRIIINEDPSTAGSSSINGELVTNFCINARNQLLYDTLDFGIDGYGNNQFTGTRIAYNNKLREKLQYGDFNLTGSAFADVDGIAVPPQYEKYGWQSFVNAIPSDNRPASKAAKTEEKRQWWK